MKCSRQKFSHFTGKTITKMRKILAFPFTKKRFRVQGTAVTFSIVIFFVRMCLSMV